MFRIVYYDKTLHTPRYSHTHRAVSHEAALKFVRDLARRRANPFPITIYDQDSIAVEFPDRDAFRAYIRTTAV